MLQLLNQPLRYCPDKMASYPMKIKGHTIKGHIAYFISDQDSKKGRIPTYTSLMEFTTSKEEHMLMFLSQITSINTLLLTKGSM